MPVSTESSDLTPSQRAIFETVAAHGQAHCNHLQKPSSFPKPKQLLLLIHGGPVSTNVSGYITSLSTEIIMLYVYVLQL